MLSREKSLLASSCPYVTVRLMLDGFVCNLILGAFMKVCRENQKISLHSGKNVECLTVKPKRVYGCGGINSL